MNSKSVRNILMVATFAVGMGLSSLPAPAQSTSVGGDSSGLQPGTYTYIPPDTGAVADQAAVDPALAPNGSNLTMTTSDGLGVPLYTPPPFTPAYPVPANIGAPNTEGTTKPSGGTTGNTSWTTGTQGVAGATTQYGLLSGGSFAGTGTIPSGTYNYGFTGNGPAINGGYGAWLPSTSTASVDLNVTDDN